MEMTVSLGIITTVVGLLLFLYGEAHNHRGVVFVGKPLASLGFLAAAHGSGALETPLGTALFVALVLSFVGDVLLIPRAEKIFMAGLGAFLLAHVAFIYAFWLRGVNLGAAGVALVALVPVAVLIGRWLLPHVAGGMRVPVLAYMSVITLMVAASVGTSVRDGVGAPALGWPAAAIIFFISDLSVARDRFVSPGFSNRTWGLPLYYGAQVWFALLAAPGAQ